MDMTARGERSTSPSSAADVTSDPRSAPAGDERIRRLCAEFLRQWPAGVRAGGPTANARAAMDEIATLADPADALWTMARYAVALDARIQTALHDRGRTAYSRLSRECDRQARLGFGDDVVDACCAFVDLVRRDESDGRRHVVADVDRLGYRAFACLTSMAAHLAEVVLDQDSEHRDYGDVVDWLVGVTDDGRSA